MSSGKFAFSTTLRTQYETTRDQFEVAHDQVLSSSLNEADKEKADIWLDDVIASLLAWNVDIRVGDGSLDAIEDQSDPTVAKIIESAFTELRLHLEEFTQSLEKYINERHVSKITCIFSDEIPEIIRHLKTLVGSVRMVHAMNAQKGPYHEMKAHIDWLVQQHISHASPEGAPAGDFEQEDKMKARPPAAPSVAPRHSAGSIAPSVVTSLGWKDRGQWYSNLPESILCKIDFYVRTESFLDKAPTSKYLATEGPRNIKWQHATTYSDKEGEEGLISLFRKKLLLHKTSQNGAINQPYVRYGVCRVIGTEHENSEGLEGFEQLPSKAIKLIYCFHQDYESEQFRLEITWEFATVQIQEVPKEKYASTICKEIGSKMTKNYITKSYIPQKDLLMIMAPEVIQRIIDEDRSLMKENWTTRERRNFASKVQLLSSRLQAVCIYRGIPMKFLKHLMDNQIFDEGCHSRRGLDFGRNHKCSEKDCAAFMLDLQIYHAFFAVVFHPDGMMQMFTREAILPIYYHKMGKDSQLGDGTLSEVHAVKIEPVHHSLSHDRNSVFALKTFHNRSGTGAVFQRKKDVIQKLFDHPHNHVNPYLATWIQDDTAFILSPRATYNLRTFISSTDKQKLTLSFVLWVLEQLKGLADAVDHLHGIFSDERTTPVIVHRVDRDQIRLDDDGKQVQKQGYLSSIKPENILVFENEPSGHRQAGIFRISDYGVGRLKGLTLEEHEALNKGSPGTLIYKAPDEKPSKAVDLWALGCVFLELLIWVMAPVQDGNRGFSDRRGWMSIGENWLPAHPNAAFWSISGRSQPVTLQLSVSHQIEDLVTIHCQGKKAFARVAEITKKLLSIDPLERPLARAVSKEMESVYIAASHELAADPECYIKKELREISRYEQATHGPPPESGGQKSLSSPSKLGIPLVDPSAHLKRRRENPKTVRR